MIKNQLFIAAALLVGVTIGYMVRPDGADEVEPEKVRSVASAKIADVGEAASVRALQARIAELEKRLAAKEVDKTAEVVAEARPVAEARGERRTDWKMEMRERIKEMRERMEKLKKENPEEYARIEKAMAQFRQARLDRTNRNLDFLSSVDTSGMTDAQKQAHEKYQDLIAQREQLEEKMHNPDVTDEDREEIFRKMFETDHALHHAARTERETLIDQATKAFGFTGDDAAAVSETLRDVISSTEQSHGFGPPPPAGGPGGPR